MRDSGTLLGIGTYGVKVESIAKSLYLIALQFAGRCSEPMAGSTPSTVSNKITTCKVTNAFVISLTFVKLSWTLPLYLTPLSANRILGSIWVSLSRTAVTPVSGLTAVH